MEHGQCDPKLRQSLVELLWDLMGTLLQPLVVNLPTYLPPYLRDTMHLIQRLGNR